MRSVPQAMAVAVLPGTSGVSTTPPDGGFGTDLGIPTTSGVSDTV